VADNSESAWVCEHAADGSSSSSSSSPRREQFRKHGEAALATSVMQTYKSAYLSAHDDAGCAADPFASNAATARLDVADMAGMFFVYLMVLAVGLVIHVVHRGDSTIDLTVLPMGHTSSFKRVQARLSLLLGKDKAEPTSTVGDKEAQGDGRGRGGGGHRGGTLAGDDDDGFGDGEGDGRHAVRQAENL
jgi:hypothetical protein